MNPAMSFFEASNANIDRVSRSSETDGSQTTR